MATCDGCSRETHDVPLPRDSNAKYIRGDVCSLRESVYARAPICDILGRSFAELGGESDVPKKNRNSSNDLTITTDVIRGGRPAVIMKDDDDNRQGLMVCVATTYSGEDISKLPRIFQHFSIPIVPNGHNSPFHLHALPEWDRGNAWLIAWPFGSTATREGIWTSQANGEGVPQVLGRDAMEFLKTDINKKREEWRKMCMDPAAAAELEADLRDHIKKRNAEKRKKQKERFYGGTGSRASSFDSVVTGINSQSWRSTMCSTTTILEEPENDVAPGTAGNAHEPEPWKVVAKARAGSAYSLASTSKKRKSGDTDKRSIKSKRSQLSFAQKPQNGSGLFNFDILRAVRVK
ncbi:hypothetical protein V8D89_008372 [Ganoderma adspersum]